MKLLSSFTELEESLLSLGTLVSNDTVPSETGYGTSDNSNRRGILNHCVATNAELATTPQKGSEVSGPLRLDASTTTPCAGV